ncbi:hypothetical protein VE25_03175 [Devosia geojensis]|uniref:Uncharacterized protein n=1 Tax=Devosia geojensis TaxID=443610 RepID=A0A0F5FYG6_9HYPH|nr:hypothetical protein [Devosia geojensis]KKB13222.1 hypothetical protein VE25_03175 [Devosia geojensis]
MGTTGTMVKDAMRALLVLALVFFNFAHAPVSASVGYDSELRPYLAATVAAFVDCGDADGNGGLAHAPCHACRIGGGADLPPAPVCALSLPRAAEPVAYVRPADTFAPRFPVTSGTPRAPPAA